jgi:hypothetical protein
MAYVYILNVYGEYGPEEVAASLEGSKIGAELVRRQATWLIAAKAQAWRVEITALEASMELAALDNALAANIPCSTNLSHGWGGYQLHIVELI